MTKLTIETLHQIAATHGLLRARFYLEQEITEYGREALAELFAEMDRLEDAEFERTGREAEAHYAAVHGE